MSFIEKVGKHKMVLLEENVILIISINRKKTLKQKKKSVGPIKHALKVVTSWVCQRHRGSPSRKCKRHHGLRHL